MDISHVCLFAQDTDTRSRWNLPRQCVAICTMEPNSNAIWCTDDTCILGMHASAYVYSRLKRIANRMLYPNRAIQWHAIFSAQGKSSSDRQSEAELKKSKGAPGGAGSKAAKSLFFPSASWGSVDFCKGALLLPSFPPFPSLPFPFLSFPFLSFPSFTRCHHSRLPSALWSDRRTPYRQLRMLWGTPGPEWQKECQTKCQNRCQTECQKEFRNRMPESMSDRCQIEFQNF